MASTQPTPRPARQPAQTASTSRAAPRPSARRCTRASSTSSGSTSSPFSSGQASGYSTGSPSSISSPTRSSDPHWRRTSATAGRDESRGMIDLVKSGDGRVHLALAGHMPYPTTATLSSQAATEIGNAYDLISANPNTFQGLDAEVEAGGPRMLLYTKAAAVRNAGLPEAMYAHRVGGSMNKANRKYDPRWKSGTSAVNVSRAGRTQTFPVGPQEGIILRHTADGSVLVG